MKINSTKHISIIFVFAIVIPGIILSLISIRAATRENAYVEYRMRNSFISDITLSKKIANDVMVSILNELDKDTGLQFDSIPVLDSLESLIQIPFILSEKREIIWPLYNIGLSSKALDFFKFNKEFFQDRVPTPIYKNVPIKKSSKGSNTKSDEVDEIIKNILKSNNVKNRNVSSKKFKTKKDYYLNKKKTQVTLKQIAKSSKLKKSVEYVESLKFSQIIADKKSGIIPRVIDNQIMLLYWRKTSDNRIQGFVLNEAVISKRIINEFPQTETEERFLTILDQNKFPLYINNKDSKSDWSKPFLTQDLHELLPQWEVAIYLSNPDLITNQARVNTIVIGLLVMILFITFTVGGVLILKSLQTEIKLAQQKTTFVANVSHELKTPLTSIRIFAEILKEDRQPDEKKRKNYLSIMVSEIERLTRLINNVLDFSQTQKNSKAYNLKRVDIIELINELVEIQRVRLEHNGFEILVDMPKAALFVNVDIESIKQVFVNIISNAEKYSTNNRSISIDVKSEEEMALVSISDRGIGIAKDSASKIFEEFYRVDDSLTSNVRGTGLGLAITKKLLEDHNGTIEYSPNKPEGSIFTVKLPLIGD